ncbi:hypothetical protein J6590_078787 [Homalodisca vitripennis]|nr:hypothetical protein J6590_078787 [Homalodisca vitripennis]
MHAAAGSYSCCSVHSSSTAIHRQPSANQKSSSVGVTEPHNDEGEGATGISILDEVESTNLLGKHLNRRLTCSDRIDRDCSKFHILDVTLYWRFKCKLTQGRDVHQYMTRGRDTCRIEQHRMIR